jgi:hypothetical protein
MRHRYWIAIDKCRGVPDANLRSGKWTVRECQSRKVQTRLLTEGFPDFDIRDADGSPILSNKGLRLATDFEVECYKEGEQFCTQSVLI